MHTVPSYLLAARFIPRGLGFPDHCLKTLQRIAKDHRFVLCEDLTGRASGQASPVFVHHRGAFCISFLLL